MKKIVLATKRPWNWKVFLVLNGLIFPAAFAIVPFSVHQLNAYNETGSIAPGWEVLVVNALINGLITSVLGGIGLVIGNHMGLGMPFVEGWASRKPIHSPFRSAISIGWIAGVSFAIVYLLLQNLVFGPAMLA